MTEKERSKMVDQIGDYILMEQFDKHETNVPEALTVLATVSDQIIRSLAEVVKEDAEEMITTYCNALQLGNEKERHYTTGSKEADELMDKIVKEMKAGGDIEEIIDKYVNCATPELRQQLIDGMNAIRVNHDLDNVTVGYGKTKDDQPVLTKTMADEIEKSSNMLLKDLMEEDSGQMPRAAILTIAIVTLRTFTGKPVKIDAEQEVEEKPEDQ